MCDIDGCLTNGGYFVSTEHNPSGYSRQFNTSDFVGIEALEKSGMKVAALTGSMSPCLAQFDRAAPFMKVHSGVFEKLEFVYENYVETDEYNWKEIAFMGDELNDGRLLSKVGLAACPADAAPEVIKIVENHENGFVMTRKGGHRAVREFTDLIRKMMDIPARWGDWVYPGE